MLTLWQSPAGGFTTAPTKTALAMERTSTLAQEKRDRPRARAIVSQLRVPCVAYVRVVQFCYTSNVAPIPLENRGQHYPRHFTVLFKAYMWRIHTTSGCELELHVLMGLYVLMQDIHAV